MTDRLSVFSEEAMLLVSLEEQMGLVDKEGEAVPIWGKDIYRETGIGE